MTEAGVRYEVVVCNRAVVQVRPGRFVEDTAAAGAVGHRSVVAAKLDALVVGEDTGSRVVAVGTDHPKGSVI